MNKKIRTIITSIMVASLLTCSTASFAAVKDNNNSKFDMKKIEEMEKITNDIANGSDYLYGGGIQPHYAESNNAPGEITPQWASGGEWHTHQFLVARAIYIIGQDIGTTSTAYYTLLNNASTLYTGADQPDIYERDEVWDPMNVIYIPTFSGHFYDPNTGNNWRGDASPTAYTRFLDHMMNAKDNWVLNQSFAWGELGRAIHYLADANQPHHAANLIFGPTSQHEEFEEWADTNRFNYGATSSLYYRQYVPNNLSDLVSRTTLYNYCSNVLITNAYNAKSYQYYADSPNGDTNPNKPWDLAAANTIPYCQRWIAAVLYNFMISVGAIPAQ